MTNRMTLKEEAFFYHKTRVLINDHGQREGQAAFNALFLVRPDIANKIRGTEYDPYYEDERLDSFYIKLREYSSAWKEL